MSHLAPISSLAPELQNAEHFASSLFKQWVDPRSGVTSYLLDARVAPFQQSFYFVNQSFTHDGRYYWFYCAFPPSGDSRFGRCLGVVDFCAQEVRWYPETQFLDASPLIDLVTGEAYWCHNLEIWKRAPAADARPVLVNRFSADLAGGRHVSCLATHLTFSADRSALNIDAQIGHQWYLGHAPLDGSAMVIWNQFDRMMHHAQFNPSDPDLQLIAQDYAVNPATGERVGIDERMWLLRRGEKPESLYPGGGSEMQGHEWWSADGRKVWYVHYHQGVEYIDLHERKVARVWPSKTVSHAHVDAAEKYVVADFLPTEKPQERRVAFFNRRTGRSLDIVSHLPPPPAGCEKYHVHPHPQFCHGDRYVCYTTTVRGRVDVAFVPVAALVEKTSN
jgi:hypothetical protein